MGGIYQPLTGLPAVFAAAWSVSRAIGTDVSSPLATAGSSVPGSKSWPGMTPILASRAGTGASAAGGGLAAISLASVVKKVAASIVATLSAGAVLMSTAGFTIPGGGV